MTARQRLPGLHCIASLQATRQRGGATAQPFAMVQSTHQRKTGQRYPMLLQAGSGVTTHIAPVQALHDETAVPSQPMVSGRNQASRRDRPALWQEQHTNTKPAHTAYLVRRYILLDTAP